MARFERDDQFREIDRDGTAVVIREGRIGTIGAASETTTQVYKSALEARHHLNERVRYAIAAEYHRVDQAPVVVDDLPDDDDARLVYADVLQLRGDPRGTLIVMQASGVDTRHLIELHAERWFGDLATARHYLGITWRLGGLARVTIRQSVELRQLMPELAPWHHVPAILDALFDLPIARRLEALVIGALPGRHAAAMVKALIANTPPTLHTLELSCELDVTALNTLTSGAWPQLRTLVVGIDGSGHAIAALAPILHRSRMTRLAHLSVSTPDPTPLASAIGLYQLPFDVVIRSAHPIDPAVLRPGIRFETL